MANILERIVEKKREEIASAKRAIPAELLEARIRDLPPPRDFRAALEAADEIALIAEFKRHSPSAGAIRESAEPVEVARSYVAHGAACLSVLTDGPFFHGSLDDLTRIREAVTVPVLRKDFILDRYQILEARAARADCVLLIAECLHHGELVDLLSAAGELGMQALVEFYDAENLETVLAAGAGLVGINNRNLKTFETDIGHTLELAAQVPEDVLLVSESGIRTREDVERLRDAGVGAMLVGETLMRAPDIGAKIDELLGRKADG